MQRPKEYERQMKYCLSKAQSAPTEQIAQIWKTIAESYQRLLELENFCPPLDIRDLRDVGTNQS